MQIDRAMDQLFSRFSAVGIAVALCAVGAAQSGCSGKKAASPVFEESHQSALSAPPETTDFAVYAQNSARLGDRTKIHGGDVGVQQSGNFPTLVSGYELVLSSEARVDATRSVVANRLQLWNQVVVDRILVNAVNVPNQNAQYSKPPYPFPSNMPGLPPLAVISPGTVPLNVTGLTPIANPGSFGAVTVGNAVTWKLRTGVYHLASLHLENDAHIEVLGPVQIRIAGRLDGLDRTKILPANGVGITAGELRIEVSGKNGNSGSLSDSPKTVQLGTDAQVSGVILAPKGTLQFGARAILTGAYLAKDINIDNDSVVTYQSGVGPSPCLECDDSNACTTDNCLVGTCVHSPVTCKPLDTCHTAGSCDPATGCSNPVKADGESCNDGDACNTDKECLNGECKGGTPRVCLGPPNCNPIECDFTKGCLAPTGCVGAGDPKTALFVQTWETGVGDWKDSSGKAAQTGTDPSSPAGATVQKVDNDQTRYQPDSWEDVQPGQKYCISAYVRWFGGAWPFIGLQRYYSGGQPATPVDWAIGLGGYKDSIFAPLTPVSATDQGWQYVSHTVQIPTDVSKVRLVDELWNGDTKGGTSLAYFDGLTIDSGACVTGPAKNVYQEWWESGSPGWTDEAGNQASVHGDQSSPAGETVQEINSASGDDGPYKSPSLNLSGGETYCVSSSVRWISGHEPFLAIQFGTSEQATILVGGPSGSTVSITEPGWQTFRQSVLVPKGTSGVKLVDGVTSSGTNTKPGDDVSYFDNISITSGPCQAPPSMEPGILPSSTTQGSSNETPGRLDGAFSVTDNGEATYKMPLWVVPGKGGVQPHLALVYGSRGSNGFMGMGWQVEGFSQISRCRRDYARDGVKKAIQFDDTDALCLDGERLVKVPVQQGQASFVYKTENDKGIRVFEAGRDQLGTIGFLAQFPDGTVRDYSTALEANRATVTANDRNLSDPTVAYDTPARMAWALTSSSDRYNNQIKYYYKTVDVTGGANGHTVIDLRPDYIEYSWIGSGSPMACRIDFKYDEQGDREDIREAYVNGMPLRSGHLLTSITMSLKGSQGGVQRKYKITYQNDPDVALLSTVTECDGASICKPDTSFEWLPQATGAYKRVVTGLKDHVDYGTRVKDDPSNVVPADSHFAVGDFNGDGLDDIAMMAKVSIGKESGGGPEPFDRWGYAIRLAKRDSKGYFTGFGPESNISLLPRNAADFAGMTGMEQTTPDDSFGRSIQVADLNLDGNADLIQPEYIYSWQTDGGGSEAYCVKFCRVNGGGSANTVNCNAGQTPDPQSPYNVTICPESWCITCSKPIGVPAKDQTLRRWNQLPALVGDFDGDGLPDLTRPAMFVPPQSGLFPGPFSVWSYVRNTKEGFALDAVPIVYHADENCSTPTCLNKYHATYERKQWDGYVVDTNGDGKSELLAWDESFLSRVWPDNGDYKTQTTRMKVFASPTSGMVGTSLLRSGHSSSDVRYQFADVNGDGLPDAIELPAAGGASLRVSINTGRDFLPPVSVVLGTGAKLGQSASQMPKYNENLYIARDPGLRVADFNGDGRADLIQLGDDCRNVGNGLSGATMERTTLSVLSAVGDGRALSAEMQPYVQTTGGSIPIGEAEWSAWQGSRQHPNSQFPTCFGGYGMSQILDVNGDGLPDIAQAEGGEIVVYVNQGTRPGLLWKISDGYGKLTEVKYSATGLAAQDPDTQDRPSLPQVLTRKNGWVVSGHTVTLQVSNAGPTVLAYEHNYVKGRADIEGLGYLGMDSHTVTDLTGCTDDRDMCSSVMVSYDRSDKRGAKFYPFKDLPALRSERYPMTDGRVVWRETKTTCDFLIENDGARAALKSCLEDRKDGEDVPAGYKGASGVRKRSRTKTTYESEHGYGYLTQRETSTGPDEDFYSANNEQTKLVRADFADSSEKWLLNMPQSETEYSYMPARPDSGTLASSLTRTRKFGYDAAKGTVTDLWLEPSSSDKSLYRKTHYDRNSAGQILKVTTYDADGNSRYTAYDYDQTKSDAFPVAARIGGFSSTTGTAVVEQKTDLLYHRGLGVLLRTVDPNGVPASRQYDGFGRLRAEQRQDGSVKLWSFDSQMPYWPLKITTTDPASRKTEVYNQFGLLDEVIELDENGNRFMSARFVYDPHGWVTVQDRPFALPGIPSHWGTYTYDGLGRITGRTDPFGAKTTWEYVWDKMTRTIEAESGKQIDEYREDQSGRIVEHSESIGAMPTCGGGGGGTAQSVKTKYVYGPFGVLSDVMIFDTTGAKVSTVHTDYDVLGRRKTVRDPDTGTTGYTYNAYGNIVARSAVGENGIDQRSQSLGYDGLGRMVSERTSEGTSTFTWDDAPLGIGKVSSTTSAPDGVSLRYEWDQRGRVAAETEVVGGVAFRFDFGYDQSGRTSSIHYPVRGDTRYSVSLGYNPASQMLQAIHDNAGNRLWRVDTRNLDRRITQESFGDGSVALHGYEPQRGLLNAESILASGSTGPNISLTFGYDKRGFLSTRTQYLNGETEHFTHDELGRLTCWQGGDSSGWSVAYTYDDIGNMKARVETDGKGGSHTDTFTSGPDPSNNHWGGIHAPTVMTSSGSGDGIGWNQSNHLYNYDGLGRRTNADSQSTVFTDFDLPRSIVEGDKRWSFLYDSGHRRALKAAGDGRSTVYVGGLYEKRTGGDGLVTHVMYVKDDGGRILAQVTQPDGGGTAIVDYPHSDQFGSVEYVSTTGGGEQQMRFDPFGYRIAGTAPPSRTTNQLGRITSGFAGQESEEEIGLINMTGRMYDPNVMRFISADPVMARPGESQGYNRYSYALNSPMRLGDPSGFFPEPLDYFYFTWEYQNIEYHVFPGLGIYTWHEMFADSESTTGYGIRFMSGHGYPPGYRPDGRAEGGERSASLSQSMATAAGKWTEVLREPAPGRVNADVVEKATSGGLGAGPGVSWSEYYAYINRSPEGSKHAALAELARSQHPMAEVGESQTQTWRYVSMAMCEVAVGMVAGLGGLAAEGAVDATRGAEGAAKAFHHTFDTAVESITRTGLRPGSYATPTAGLSPLQAHIELALDAAKGARNAILEINLQGLRAAGYKIPSVTRVSGQFGMAGGGFEMQFPYAIPPEFIRLVQP